MRHVLGEVSLTENAPRTMVAQSSALMKCAPLFTARQWLKRWHGAEQPLKRLLSDAGLEEEPALAATVGALLGGGSGVGESGGGGVQLSDLVTDMARLLLGLSRGRRGLALAVEGAPFPACVCFPRARTHLRTSSPTAVVARQPGRAHPAQPPPPQPHAAAAAAAPFPPLCFLAPAQAPAPTCFCLRAPHLIGGQQTLGGETDAVLRLRPPSWRFARRTALHEC